MYLPVILTVPESEPLSFINGNDLKIIHRDRINLVITRQGNLVSKLSPIRFYKVHGILRCYLKPLSLFFRQKVQRISGSCGVHRDSVRMVILQDIIIGFSFRHMPVIPVKICGPIFSYSIEIDHLMRMVYANPVNLDNQSKGNEGENWYFAAFSSSFHDMIHSI